VRATAPSPGSSRLIQPRAKKLSSGGVVKEGGLVGVDDPIIQVITWLMTLGTPTETSLPPDTQHELENGVSEPHAVAEPTVPTLDEQIAIPIRNIASPSQNQPQDQAPSTGIAPIPAVESIENLLKTSDVPPTTENNEPPAPIEPEPVRANDTTSPPSDTSKSKGRRRGRKPRSSPSQRDVSNAEPAATEAEPTIPSQPTETPQEQEAPPEIEPAKTQKEKRGRGRTPAKNPSQASAPTDEAPVEDIVSESLSKNETVAKKARGRKRKNQEVTEKSPSSRREPKETSPNEAEMVTEAQDATVAPQPAGLSEGQPNDVGKGKKRAGRPKKLVTQSPEPAKESPRADKEKRRDEELEAAEEQPGSDTSRAAKRRKRRALPEPDVEQREQPEPEGGVFQADRRRKRKERDSERERPSEEETHQDPKAGTSRAAKRKRDREEKEQPSSRRKQATPEQEEPEPEVEGEVEVEQEPQAADREQTKPTKGRRGRRPASQPEEQPAEEGTAAEASQPTKRKPRQPRGETVPVTVHRIANATSLSGAPIEAQSASEDEAGSADEASTKQTGKLPTRGGVNPADVLAQICRETLEKTLTTLKNGIDNEANAARRQEWTLRRKAVEAFGAELEGRLFELSEMLDSNFMLGVKVKKAKRNMMDLRARLDQVRREREGVALRMDAVRREHMIREESRMVSFPYILSTMTLSLTMA